jgi:single-stranded-DNA-specific exonuclease
MGEEARARRAAQLRESAAAAEEGGHRRRHRKIVETESRGRFARTVIVVAGDGWHRGVIGIVASKLVDALHPGRQIVSSVDGEAAYG